MSLDIKTVRNSFPGLKSGYIFGDNAGGSQCAQGVIDRIYDYLSNTNVQLGADYSVSQLSTSRVALGATYTAALINASSYNEIVYGPSSTMLLENLARALDGDVLDGEEIIITGEHEANVGPWKKLAVRRNGNVKTVFWPHSPISPNSANPYAVTLALQALIPLITPKTRLVAFSATSNILGSVNDVEAIIKEARKVAAEKGVRKIEFVVDCVAFAPHRRMDVKAWDVDYAVFSYYKVYGPHTSVLYARTGSLESSLSSLAHHFLPVKGKAYRLQPGGPGYEGVYASTGVLPYLLSLSSSNPTIKLSDAQSTRFHDQPGITNGDEINEALNDAFAKIAEYEQSELVEPLIKYLKSKWDIGVRIVGDEEGTGHSRVPTISFVVVGDQAPTSREIVGWFDKKGGIGIRYGHFYAYNLVESLPPPNRAKAVGGKIDMDDSVVRISFVHYNTKDDVKKVEEILEEGFAKSQL